MSTVKPMIRLIVEPSAYNSGGWHPAIYTGGKMWYWPNITMSLEEDAVDSAKQAIMGAQMASQGVVSSWNIWPVEE